MGCGGSKVDDLPLVVLCRERKEVLKAASDHRYALAAAHVAYFHSLRDVGDAIRRFVDEGLVIASSSTPPASPVLTLPSREGKSRHVSKNSSTSTSLSHSIDTKSKYEEVEDSHLRLSSGSDLDSDSGSGSGHIHIHDTPGGEEEEEDEEGGGGAVREIPSTYNNNFNDYPQPQGNWGFPNYSGDNPYPNPYPNPYSYENSYANTYYMKRSATPAKTVVYEDPSVNGYSDGGSGYYGGGYFGYPMVSSPARKPSPEKPPPVPPSPPRVSTWDYFNVFDAYDNGGSGGYPGYHPYARYGYGSSTSSPDSKEVREREGIPDLEDETEQEVIKEVHKEKKKASEEMDLNGKMKFNEEMLRNYGEGTSKSVHIESSSESLESVKGKGIKSSMSPNTIQSPDSIVSKSPEEGSVRKKGVSFEVEDASNVTVEIESSKPSSVPTTTLSAHGTRDLQEVVKEIRDEFETASGFGNEVALMLEVSKLPYQCQQRSSLLKVILSRILYLVSSHRPARPSVRISSRTMKMAKSYPLESGNDFDMRRRNLSSTLQEIYAWEKKLYKEVRVWGNDVDEERLRVIYEKECKRLKMLDDRGAESSKIDATQASIRKLLTKINVCIRAVDAISSKIHRLRDEELQPQITELIHGLIRMWKSMLRCHQKQFQAIMDSKVRSLKAQRDSGLKATVELEVELVNWCTCFNNWINTQKSYVESLNGWLLRCLHQEPEVTADGIVPFSPSRIGAPPIFVICNDWYQGIVRISEQEGVENAMLGFTSSLHQLWERQDEEQRQRIKAEYLTSDFEKQLKTLQMEKGRIGQERGISPLHKTMSKVSSESGISPLDDLKVDLDSMRKKLEEERARHKETARSVHDAASSSLQAGLVPIFQALGKFTSEVLKAHEEVRL
ncbi:nitrate regulatory gene2 protein-like isoform X1 [Populus alba x Populus x berolinensis]|nr:nitrate regulatory gene2 protein-like isoform X1 [Populus alba x Populus x berolinensis]